MALLSDLESRLAEIWKPSPRPNPLEWAEANIVLDKRFSPRPGRFDMSYTPYMAGPHRWFSDPKVRQITLVKSTQLGGTTLLANLIMWAIAEDPGPMLYVSSTREQSKSWSERELIPRLKACPRMAAFLPADSDDFRRTEMHFSTCTLALTGSNSEGNLASRPVRYLFADEVDKWPEENTREAPAIDLARARTNFYRQTCKIVLVSTPTTEAGAIWEEFLAGSQHRYHVACPHCQHEQPLVFEQIKWPAHHKDTAGVWDVDAVARDAWYECPKCSGHWIQSQQQDIIRRALGPDRDEWIATNPKAPAAHISAHVSSLYSPQFTWGDLARIFLQKKGTSGGLHDFYNNYLGLPFRQTAAEVEEVHLAAHRADYEFGAIPVATPKIVAILLGADHQQSFTNYVVRAFSGDDESWLLDYGKIANPEDLVAWATAQRYGERRINAGLIDSGYATERIYRTCLDAGRAGFRLLPAKGSGEKFLSKPVRLTDMAIGSRTFKNKLVMYSDSDFKRLLYLDILRDQKQRWWFPATAGSDYTAELLRERMVTVQNSRGYEETIWKRFGPNHAADAEKLCLVAWWGQYRRTTAPGTGTPRKPVSIGVSMTV
jgi:phage terminase large subunit GpA-like protein